MIGLSPLPTGHPLRFQPKWVRPSTGSYPRFSLPMGSSPGFASTTRDSCRRLKDSLSLRLASKLNLAAHRDSLAHSTKGTPSHRMGAPTARGRAVSGAVSLPSRGAFHLSLTVLVRYRSRESVQPWRVVPPASRGVSRAPRYSGPETRCQRPSGYGALTLFRRPSQAVPLDGWFVTAAEVCGPRLPRPTTPARKRPHACTRAGLGWPGFARRYSRDLG